MLLYIRHGAIAVTNVAAQNGHNTLMRW